MSTSDGSTSCSTNNSFKTPRTRIEALNSLQYIPFCPEEKKPKVGQVFVTLESAEFFYKEYCTICGFTPRLTTTKKIKGNELPISFALRNVVCNRQGVKESRKRKRTDTDNDTAENDAQSDVTDISRVRPITRIDCRVLVQFKYQENGTYIVKVLKLGGVKAYRGWKELCGGYDNIGATEVDFKNFVRDIKTYIGNFDAQIFVENLIGKKDTCSSFYFDFIVDENKCLAGVFWADPIYIKNYMLFDEVLLADATYGTNKWLFKRFLEAMGGCHPRIIITDQDKSMKSVVPEVFKESTHRLCMWHIMKKLREKVSYQLFQDEDFKSRLNRCVWTNQLEPNEFEEQWGKIMTDYQLVEHGWFSDLYDIREQWIPAYFKEVSMSGLMRVTSRSESENSFFDRFLTPHFTLVEFWVCYESALEAQRHKLSNLNRDNKHSEIPRKTNSILEVHASEIYSHNIFKDF
ncbi:protein FAR1-RELATED SEQUENCE 5-like [Silene latifolia]|uniref:protein FAR1-RELATED SEQUENCE 5-like n=1 Tax=Silene latifolia TaxID=37657 RepID=UPI003D77B0EE